MELTLRNGERITLDWNPIVLEYLEDYEGGIEQLKKDTENEKCRFRAFNFIIYCIISAVYPKELGYAEAVSLVDINDLDRIITFIIQNVNNIKLANNQKENKKYPQIHINNRKHRK